MKRTIITAVLLIGGALNAHANTSEDTYHDLIRPNGHPRSDAVFNAALDDCYKQTGASRNSRDTPAFRQCMRRHDWQWQSVRTVRTPEAAQSGPGVCSAKVLNIVDTGIGLNHHSLATMTLRVTPPHGRAFVTTISRAISNHNPPVTGSSMSVTCDPANPQDIHPA